MPSLAFLPPFASTPLARTEVLTSHQSLLPLTAEGLTFRTGDRVLVDIETLSIGSSGATMILGPNGAGKSLLIQLLHGLIVPTTGRISFGGRPIDTAARKRQAMVFQRPVMLRRSVASNLGFALKAQGVGRAERAERTARLLVEGGFEKVADQPARTLSGGEQQRLAMLRALSTEPELVFLDEPTSSLDPQSTLAIEEMVARAVKRGVKVVMVTHDIGQARRLGHEMIFMHHGRLTEQTPAANFFDQPESAPARDFLAGQILT
ncbi:sulfate/tungstate uptake family ABC transporter, ATP-binding protein [Fulvimarina pelagi HTCC2506]|uniref:Sulfate/tungstate uptake family ABC transporter, ATP-binding protein n=1 Tax=Fulvimarina pelagi HTCC2506 TaxID=314231 RepID=Q0G139_9HYPH|nr:ATP-binding cassette domain-containing protein [Fulvimarina pelagi]EAU40800.1 sulfate/tungstate uptake family ABC transporter, ATP-binding protein [Fulvimarina pelagi HTCC2506]